MIELFERLLIYLGILVIGALIYLIGCLAVGSRKEGGKRLVLSVAGSAVSVLAAMGILHFYPAFAAQDYPRAIAVPIAFLFLAFGVSVVAASVFGSTEIVRNLFKAVLRGL